jgi:hypothetical protein
VVSIANRSQKLSIAEIASTVRTPIAHGNRTKEGESPSCFASEIDRGEAGISAEYTGLLAPTFPLFDELTKRVALPD